MAKVIWTKQVREDFENLLEYIGTDAPVAVHRLGRKLLDRIEALERHPNLGAFLPEDDTGAYRQILQGNCRIIYRAEGNAVYLIALYHAARLLDPDDLD